MKTGTWEIPEKENDLYALHQMCPDDGEYKVGIKAQNSSFQPRFHLVVSLSLVVQIR